MPILWSGALTSSSIRIVARSSTPQSDELLVWHAIDGMPANANRINASRVISDWNGVLQFDVVDLLPLTPYRYALASNVTNIAHFRTPAPVGAPFNFTFVAAACSDSGADHPVYSHLAATKDALFFVQTGDLHYGDIATDDARLFREQYDLLFAQPTQRAVFAAFPMSQVPDDHDFGPNNADGQSPSKRAAHQVYREAQPHYSPLAQSSDDEPLFAHSFRIARSLFVVTDLRSDKSPEDEKLVRGPRVLMSEWQLAWFKDTLQNASTDSTVDVVFWVEGVPFIDSDADAGLSGSWACCPDQRTDIARFVHSLTDLRGRFFAISGDAHGIMVDNGTNNIYHREHTNDTSPGFPIFHAASLSRTPSTKGGPYSHGCASDWNQYGRISVTDIDPSPSSAQRRRVCVEFTGYEWSSSSGSSELGGSVRERVRYNSCDSSRDIIGDLECEGADLAELAAPYKNEIIAAIVLSILVVLLIIGCIVVVKLDLLSKCNNKRGGGNEPEKH